MSAEKMVNINLLVPESVRDHFDRQATESMVSMSSVIRSLLTAQMRAERAMEIDEPDAEPDAGRRGSRGRRA